MINSSVDVTCGKRCSFASVAPDYEHHVCSLAGYALLEVRCRSQSYTLASFNQAACDLFQVEERIPVVLRANEAVGAATEKVRQLKLEVFERGVKIDQLNRQLAAAEVEVEQTRDRANNLEERFTQVGNEDAPTVPCSISNPILLYTSCCFFQC